MPYNLVKSMFLEASGRMDLDNASLTGAKWFINQGQRFLDSRIATQKSLSRHVVYLPIGSYSLVYPNARAITEVWSTSSLNVRSLLERQSVGWLRENFPTVFDSVDTTVTPPIRVSQGTSGQAGDPLYWSPAVIGLSPEQNRWWDLGTPDGNRADLDGVLLGDHHNFDGILIMPPAEEATTITLVGNFFSLDLEEPGDQSFWTERYPNLLVFAACYQLECFYRNTQGANDWLAAIQQGLRGISNDVVMQEIAGVSQMEG